MLLTHNAFLRLSQVAQTSCRVEEHHKSSQRGRVLLSGFAIHQVLWDQALIRTGGIDADFCLAQPHCQTLCLDRRSDPRMHRLVNESTRFNHSRVWYRVTYAASQYKNPEPHAMNPCSTKHSFFGVGGGADS